MIAVPALLRSRRLIRASGIALAASLVLTGCHSPHSRNNGAAVGTFAGATLGAIIGGNSGSGALGGAIIGGMTGLILGSFVDELNERDRQAQAHATSFALDHGSGGYYDWNSPDAPGRIHGRTQVLDPMDIRSAPVTYCLAPDGRVFWLEGYGCPARGGIIRISEAQYYAIIYNPPRPEHGQHRPYRECRTARETVVIDGRAQSRDAQYCRDPYSNRWELADW